MIFLGLKTILNLEEAVIRSANCPGEYQDVGFIFLLAEYLKLLKFYDFDEFKEPTERLHLS